VIFSVADGNPKIQTACALPYLVKYRMYPSMPKRDMIMIETDVEGGPLIICWRGF